MAPSLKFLVGLGAVVLMGWVNHGPLGRGAALIDQLEGRAKAAVAEAEVPGVDVRLGRDPLSRAATLSGPADDLQREGLGGQKGLNDIVREIEGISDVRWADELPAKGSKS